MKTTTQQGSITTIVLIVILIVVSVGGYMYMQNEKAAPITEGQPVSATVEFEDGFTN